MPAALLGDAQDPARSPMRVWIVEGEEGDAPLGHGERLRARSRKGLGALLGSGACARAEEEGASGAPSEEIFSHGLFPKLLDTRAGLKNPDRA